MFLDFYNLRDQPFGVTPDPAYLYLGESHREALASLYYAIVNERGFAALIAGPGMGKTTLLFQLLERLPHESCTAFLFQTQCDSSQFLRYLLADLGCPSSETDPVVLHLKLTTLLVRESQAGRQLVVAIDEAQNLNRGVLETIRLLSDFETPQRKLMQIIMAGQPQFAETLARSSMSQFLQRVSIFKRLLPFTPQEVREYLAHRLKVAGYSGNPLFSLEAMALIAQHSQGVPRTINNLCFHALSLGFAKRQKTVDATTVREVLADLDIHQACVAAAPLSRPVFREGRGRDPFPPSSSVLKDPVRDRRRREDARALRPLPPLDLEWIQWMKGLRKAQMQSKSKASPIPYSTRKGTDQPLPSLPTHGSVGGESEKLSSLPEVRLPERPVGNNSATSHSGSLPHVALAALPIPSLAGEGTDQPLHPMLATIWDRLSSLAGKETDQPLPSLSAHGSMGSQSEKLPSLPGVGLKKESAGNSSATSRFWSLPHLALTACLALALLAWFSYMAHLAGYRATVFGGLQPKSMASAQAGSMPASTPSQQNILKGRGPASPISDDQANVGSLPAAPQEVLPRKTSALAQDEKGDVSAGTGGSSMGIALGAVSGGSLEIVVARNRNLRQICLRYLGRYSQSLVDEIVRLNPRLRNPDCIMTGQRLRLPVTSERLRESTSMNAATMTDSTEKR